MSTKGTVDTEVLGHGCRNLLFPFALLVMFAKNECCVSKHMAMPIFSMNGISKYTYLQAQTFYIKTCACVCLCMCVYLKYSKDWLLLDKFKWT